MRYIPPNLYSAQIPDLKKHLEKAVEQGLSHRKSSQPVELFFRADDIGIPSHMFTELIRLFQHYQLPLCLATVPAWITPSRYNGLRDITGYDDTLWCWHQHGRLHKNFEHEGKKQEFGPARDKETIKRHLELGKDRLKQILGEAFQPYFTPPWNRCSLDTAVSLNELNFSAISRYRNAKPDFTGIITDIQVNVDLHTRKEPDLEISLTNLLTELENSLATERCGIMIHHQRLNENGLIFLDTLLSTLKQCKDIQPKQFNQLL